ncbi:hypothetical protein [Amycolatopsis sp. NBC_01480]|uniref:hypothetical protein n=1 Tax=Amycolatopsis sp. NBC_01480 TaxID=2903562 RepID=UPI002E29E72B|nr:hypothetical protein [Amycolatopsis sp. NBC_01480]
MLSSDDHVEIGQTLALHGHFFDSGHLDRIEEIRKTAAELGPRIPLAHHVTNLVITETGTDFATVRSKGLTIMANGAFAGVDHLDTVHRHDGCRRISRRVVTPRQGRQES